MYLGKKKRKEVKVNYTYIYMYTRSPTIIGLTDYQI